MLWNVHVKWIIFTTSRLTSFGVDSLSESTPFWNQVFFCFCFFMLTKSKMAPWSTKYNTKNLFYTVWKGSMNATERACEVNHFHHESTPKWIDFVIESKVFWCKPKAGCRPDTKNIFYTINKRSVHATEVECWVNHFHLESTPELDYIKAQWFKLFPNCIHSVLYIIDQTIGVHLNY